VPSFSADGGAYPHHIHCDLLVATRVAQALADQGIHGPEARELMENPSLRFRDLALLGLGSLDWITLATQLEAETGVQLPDHVLVESAHRCVNGWSNALLTGGVAEPTRRSGP
jgi:acyl carrier protein